MTNETKNILIIEDEFSIAMDMEMRLQKMNYHVVGIANSYNEALPHLLENDIDIALLDINLNSEKSGIDLGKLIRDKFNIPIIFITAYTDTKTFTEAAGADPMGFITKPVKDADLRNNIELALSKFRQKIVSNPEIETNNNAIFVKDKGVLKQITIDEILWLEALDNYTVIHTAIDNHIVHAFLKDVLTKLGNSFIRIHRSHAVSLKKITSVEDNLVYIGKEFLIVSQNYRSDLLERMKIL
ncbi:MAG: hypothetical protein CVU11_08725 [Bacteroidetes bacterium HGW-Bacteroidetes-6]|jgi:DNA-binding LytR/AlgR family response regulator|nr:MAG: hypothetical protein CVU11_08725 [Bacteroidetes bacterium HGW-Bacteroidetes-6]